MSKESKLMKQKILSRKDYLRTKMIAKKSTLEKKNTNKTRK